MIWLIRLMRRVIVIGYLYRFGAWLMHLFMVQVEVQVDVWLMHGSGYWYRLAIGQWYRLVQLYNGISHSDSMTMVSSSYLYFRATGRGKDRWL